MLFAFGMLVVFILPAIVSVLRIRARRRRLLLELRCRRALYNPSVPLDGPYRRRP